MKKLLMGDCHPNNIFYQLDPTEFMEIDFEAEVVKALCCLYPEYFCGVFAGSFVLEGDRRTADLALIHRSLSHWFVVEVELAGHSLEQHILPQVRCFRYGEPDSSCVSSLCRAFPEITRANAENLLLYVPRFVAVIGNIYDPDWLAALNAVDVQLLTVSVYKGENGRTAHEVEGRLSFRTESLGFVEFSAPDNSLKLPKSFRLPLGTIQILDHFGNLSSWTLREDGEARWLTKDRGPALIEHQTYVQIMRTYDGRISIRLSR